MNQTKTEDILDSSADFCFVCRDPSKPTFICAKCKIIKYCSRSHQRLHWNLEHRKSCGNDCLQQPDGKWIISGSQTEKQNTSHFYRSFGCCMDCCTEKFIRQETFTDDLCKKCKLPHICRKHNGSSRRKYDSCFLCRYGIHP